MTGRRSRATKSPDSDPLPAVRKRLRDRANADRANKRRKRSGSRELWLGVDARTVASASRQVNKNLAGDPDAVFNAAERLIHGSRFREEKELALGLVASVANGLTEAHLVRCLDWFAKLADADLVDKLATTIGATIAEMPSAQRRLSEMARHMDPLHRLAAVRCATSALTAGMRGLKTALIIAEIVAQDRAPSVQQALGTLLADLSREAPKQAMPFLVRYCDDLPTRVFEAALSTLPASQQRQLQGDRARGRR